MTDPVTILGTVAGVASLAIQLTQILHDYCKGVSDSGSDVQGLLADTQQLSQVLTKLEDLVRNDSLKLSQSFTTTSTLYLANVRCEVRLRSLLADLKKHSQGSQARQALKALKWPFKTRETRDISAELHGYTQTFQFALTLDGCEILLKTSGDVSTILQNSLRSATITEESAENIGLILTIVTPLPEVTLAIQEDVKILIDENMLKWLGATDTSAKHQTVKRRRSPNTGQWIFQDKCYKQWENDVSPVLWAQGKPGAGKSTLMSCIVDKLKADAGRGEGVASFYCDYSQTSDVQTPEAILASFSYQLLRRLDSIPVEVNSIYHRHRRENTRPDLNEHVEILKHISTAFSKVWLLIDALDEFGPDCRDDLARVIETLMTFTKVLVTSRPQSIDSENLEGHTLRCTISAQDEDLKVFIESRMATASRGIRESPGWNVFVSDAQEKLVTLADGMFILVSLQLDMLLRLHTVTEMRRALETISDKLDDFYKITLDRIRAGKSDKPLKILAWLVTSRLPITVGALREALAVEDSTTFIDPNAMIPEDDIVPMCCGLVLTHVGFLPGSRVLSLAHATVHEYLSKNLEMVHGFDRIIAKACVRFLDLLDFSTEWEPDLDRQPFFLYAILISNSSKCDIGRFVPPVKLKAKLLSDGAHLKTNCGTPFCAGPEVVIQQPRFWTNPGGD